MSSSGGDGPETGRDLPPGQGDVRLVLVTAPEEEARSLARTLVEERLAACGNILPGVRSIYRWKGGVEEAAESLLILKTPRSLEPLLLRRIPQLHSYDVPEVLVVEIPRGHIPYLEWVARESGAPPGAPGVPGPEGGEA